MARSRWRKAARCAASPRKSRSTRFPRANLAGARASRDDGTHRLTNARREATSLDSKPARTRLKCAHHLAECVNGKFTDSAVSHDRHRVRESAMTTLSSPNGNQSNQRSGSVNAELAGDSEPAAYWPRHHHREPSRVAALSSTIAQCLNLQQEIHHTASKLCILGFELP